MLLKESFTSIDLTPNTNRLVSKQHTLITYNSNKEDFMLKLMLICLSLGISSFVFACDEQCKKDQLAATKQLIFANHLNLKYCHSTVSDFLLNTRKSLGNYHEKQLPTAHRGGARNIRNFINARKDWLVECDQYMTAMEYGSVFRKRQTTAQIFKAMDETAQELEKLMKTPSQPSEDAAALVAPASEKFSQLFELMDAYMIELQKRGVL